MADPAEFSDLVVVDHPLIQNSLTLMRVKDTPSEVFRAALRRIAPLLAYEATRDLPVTRLPVETRLATTDAPVLAAGPPVLVSILRAGLTMAAAIHDLMPTAPEGHIGLRRDERTKRPVEYVVRLPDIEGHRVLLVDPMVATGNSASHAVDVLNRHGATDADIRFLALVCAPEGVRRLRDAHPGVRLYAAALDEGLDEDAFIVPGLGDAGDRLFGTE